MTESTLVELIEKGVSAGIAKAMENGLGPAFREASRKEAQVEIGRHLAVCPAALSFARRNYWAITVATLLLGSVIGTGFWYTFQRGELQRKEIKEVIVEVLKEIR